MKKVDKKLVLKTQVIRALSVQTLQNVGGGVARPVCTYAETGCTDSGERR